MRSPVAPSSVASGLFEIVTKTCTTVTPAKGDLCTTVIPAKAGIQGGGGLARMVSFTAPDVASSEKLRKGLRRRESSGVGAYVRWCRLQFLASPRPVGYAKAPYSPTASKQGRSPPSVSYHNAPDPTEAPT